MTKRNKANKPPKDFLDYHGLKPIADLVDKLASKLLYTFVEGLIEIGYIDTSKVEDCPDLRFRCQFVEGKGYKLTIKFGIRQWIMEDET